MRPTLTTLPAALRRLIVCLGIAGASTGVALTMALAAPPTAGAIQPNSEVTCSDFGCNDNHNQVLL